MQNTGSTGKQPTTPNKPKYTWLDVLKHIGSSIAGWLLSLPAEIRELYERSHRISWFTIGLVLVAVIALVGWRITDDNRALQRLTEEASSLQQDVFDRKIELDDLRGRLEKVGSAEQLESNARELDFISPGEIRYEITNPELLKYYTEEECMEYLKQVQLGRF